nr:hypothetical protein [Agromyces marinus]
MRLALPECIAPPERIGHERLDGGPDRCSRLGVEPRVEVHDAVPVFAHRERALLAKLFFAWLHAVGIEPGFGLAHTADHDLEGSPLRKFGERRLRDLDEGGVGAQRHPVEHRADRRSRLEADRGPIERLRDVRPPGWHPLTGDRRARRSRRPDGDEARGVAA